MRSIIICDKDCRSDNFERRDVARDFMGINFGHADQPIEVTLHGQDGFGRVEDQIHLADKYSGAIGTEDSIGNRIAFPSIEQIKPEGWIQLIEQ